MKFVLIKNCMESNITVQRQSVAFFLVLVYFFSADKRNVCVIEIQLVGVWFTYENSYFCSDTNFKHH